MIESASGILFTGAYVKEKESFIVLIAMLLMVYGSSTRNGLLGCLSFEMIFGSRKR